MLYLLAYSGQGQLRIFGPSNEKYHVVGGQRAGPDATRVAAPWPDHARHRAGGVGRNGDGTWTVTTQSGSRTSSRVADHVVLTLPFSLLRKVDLSKAGFQRSSGRRSPSCRWARTASCSCSSPTVIGGASAATGTASPTPAIRAPGRSPEHNRAQRGILVDYTGGDIGADFGVLSPAEYGRRFLDQIEPCSRA
jgi:monoamine oxidase